MHRNSTFALLLGLLVAMPLFPSAGYSQQDSLTWIREVDQFARDFIATARLEGPAGVRARVRPASVRAQQMEDGIGKMRREFSPGPSDSLKLIAIDVGTIDSISGKKLTYTLKTPTQRAILRLLVAEPDDQQRYVDGMEFITEPAQVARVESETAQVLAAQHHKDRYEMQLEGTAWGITLEIPGFDIGEEQESPDGRAKMMEAVNRKTGIILSIYIERQRGKNTPEACRDFYWKRMRRDPRRKTNVQFTSQAPLALARYMIENAEGMRVMEQNMNAYYGQSGVCMDLHLSKLRFVPGDEALFDAVLQSVRIVGDTPGGAPTAHP